MKKLNRLKQVDGNKLLPITTVIEDRLAMQSVQKDMERIYGLCAQRVDKTVVAKYRNLDEDNQKQLVRLLGGPVNFKRTKDYIESL